jgi:hypothetical protein
MRRLGSILLVLATLTWIAASPGALFAQRSRTGLSPEDQKKYDELMRSAQQHQSVATIAIAVGACFCALGLLFGAYSIFRKGLKVTQKKRLEGAPAQAIATLLALLAIGLAVAGILYAPSILP